jgi:hypothetical protein
LPLEQSKLLGKGLEIMKRKSIPSKTRHEVLQEAGYKCGNPACRNILTLQLHHIEWVKDGGGNEPENLLPLCGHCHDMHTQGHIPNSAIHHWKGILHALNYAFTKESMDLLIFLNKISADELWFSGDGLLRFSSLIASGYVEIAESHFAIGVRYGNSPPTNPPSSGHRVRLTDKGHNLVESWIKGDEDQLQSTLDFGK